MLAIGVVVMALTITACFEAGAYLNRDDAPAWTRRGWVGEAAALLFVLLISMATAGLITGLIDAAKEGVGAVDAGLTVAAVVLAVLFGRLRRRRRKAAAMSARAPQPVDVPAMASVLADQPAPPLDQPPAGGPMRRAA